MGHLGEACVEVRLWITVGPGGCPCVSDLKLEVSIGLRNPPEMECDALPEAEDATHGTHSLCLPEPATALRQTVLLGCSWGT